MSSLDKDALFQAIAMLVADKINLKTAPLYELINDLQERLAEQKADMENMIINSGVNVIKSCTETFEERLEAKRSIEDEFRQSLLNCALKFTELQDQIEKVAERAKNDLPDLSRAEIDAMLKDQLKLFSQDADY